MTLKNEDIEHISGLRKQGHSYREIAQQTGHSPTTIQKYCNNPPRGLGQKQPQTETKKPETETEELEEPQKQEEKNIPYDRIFEIYDNDGSPVEVVKEGLTDPDTAKECYKKYCKIKNLNPTTIQLLNNRIKDLYQRVVDNYQALTDEDKHPRPIKCQNCGEFVSPLHDPEHGRICEECGEELWIET